MKLFISGLLALLFSITASAGEIPKGCTDEDVAIAQGAYDATAKAVERDAILPIEKMLAQAALLDVQVCAGKLTDETYCAQKRELLKAFSSAQKLLNEKGISDGNLAAHFAEQAIQFRNACR